MSLLRVKNWRQFQHYKNRCPPWIKLHRRLLDDPDFNRLPVASKALAPYVWLLASESEDGTVTAVVADLSFRLRLDASMVADGLNGLIAGGFLSGELVVASIALASRQQVATSERETETEGETEKPPAEAAAHRAPRSRDTWLTPYGAAWRDRWGDESEPPFGEMSKPMRTAEKRLGAEEALQRWVRFLASSERPEWARPHRFLQGLGQWSERTEIAPAKSGAPVQRRMSIGDVQMAEAAKFLGSKGGR